MHLQMARTNPAMGLTRRLWSVTLGHKADSAAGSDDARGQGVRRGEGAEATSTERNTRGLPVALVVVVPGPRGPDPRSAAPGARRPDPTKRVVTALSSSLRAMRGRIPPADEIDVLDFADLFTRRPVE